MTYLPAWQRFGYFFTEFLVFGGMLWVLYIKFVKKSCPLPGLISPHSLIIGGLILGCLVMSPFGDAPYLAGPVRRIRAVAVVWWLLAIAGLAASFAEIVFRQPPAFGLGGIAPAIRINLWLYLAVPGLLYFIFAIQPRSDRRTTPPVKAPPPPDSTATDGEGGADE